jgi:hypothetical protein
MHEAFRFVARPRQMSDDVAMRTHVLIGVIGLSLLGLSIGGCGDDNPPPYTGTPADLVGVGAVCKTDTDCLHTDAGVQHCLTEFKGGYCGLKGCTASADCPAGSGCVNYNGATYCFRRCADKSECNLNRPVDLESNCSSNVDFVEGKSSDKPCVPPSG